MYRYKKIIKKVVNIETLNYVFFGVFTMGLALAVYNLLLYLGMDYQIANLFSLIIGKLASYVCNKVFVFKIHQTSFFEWIKEFGRFVWTRGATFLLDYFGLIFAVEVMKFDKVISKYFLVLLVLILNYIFGKKIVFKSSK